MKPEMMIEVDGLNKQLNGESVLTDVTFSFAKKGIHGILGPERAGKTVLMDILAGVDPYFYGTVHMADRTLGVDSILWKRKIGYMAEGSVLDSEMTVEELLDFVGRARGVASEKRYRQIKEALELTGLSDLKKRLTGRLTRGQRKKLELAASLLGNPDVILMDAPEHGLIAAEREELFDLIRMLGTMKTVVLATNRFEVAVALCEDVALLADGRVLAVGSFASLEETLHRNTNSNTLSLKEIYHALSTPSAVEQPKKEDEE